MHPALQRNLYLIKEHVGMFKASNHYDVYDPATGELLIECREPNLGAICKLFRFTDYKRMTPFRVELNTPQGQPVLEVKRGVCLLRSHVDVLDNTGTPIGGFKQRLFSIGGAFGVEDVNGQELCTLKGKWSSWEFVFAAGDMELARVTKKWAGVGRELFTSADNYMLSISDVVEPQNPVRQLIMAAVVCIDMVLKE